MWLEDSNLREKIKEWWKEMDFDGSPSLVWWKKINALKEKLKVWNKVEFGRVDRKIEERVARIDEIDKVEEEETLGDDVMMERYMRREDLDYLLGLEEISWRQKSREIFFKDGQSNTKYFHAMANARRRRNNISSLFIDGKVSRNREDIKNHVVGFFDNLFKEERKVRPKLGNLHFDAISSDEKVGLETTFSEEEVLSALGELESNKAPGPDGFPMGHIRLFRIF
ncbi:hypothetical protein ACHQM5_001740 [Ranunculus cassubicifolius]